MIDRHAKTAAAGRCTTCGAPLQPVVYVDARADLACPVHGHQAIHTRGVGLKGKAAPTKRS